jgi:hypothetical protein
MRYAHVMDAADIELAFFCTSCGRSPEVSSGPDMVPVMKDLLTGD